MGDGIIMDEELSEEISDIIIELPDKSGKSPIEDFILGQQGDMGVQEILNVLLEGDTNLDLKTHILKPKQLSSLIVFANYLKSIELKNSAKLINDFIETFKRLMVSYKRLSRVEIIKAVSSIIEKERLSNTEKLTTKLT